MRSKAQSFLSTGDGLAKITTDGWNSRAGERFRDKFSTEPDRWRESGQGFLTAAAALDTFASAVERAQARAAWAEQEYSRGDQVSNQAKADHDRALAASTPDNPVPVLMVDDPGDAVRQGAVNELGSAKADLDAAAHACASGVRRGCDAAPQKRHWWESVGAAIGGFLEGAGEALMDLGKLAAWLTMPEFVVAQSLLSDAMSGMTAEEIAAKWELKLEDVGGMLDALRQDPLEFGKQLGKGMLDWDTWSDDPARALGHLLPDAIIAVLTLGEGTVATRGAEGVEGAVEGVEAVEALSATERLAGLTKVDELDALTAFDDVPTPPQSTLRRLDDPDLEPWLDSVMEKHPELDRDGVRGTWDYSTDDGYRQMNGHMREPGSAADPDIQGRVDAANKGLDQLPSYEGVTYRGTNVPQSVLDRALNEGVISDQAFSSSSLSRDVAENFVRPGGENPIFMRIQGHSGVNVQPFSAAQHEAEILFRGGTEFRVVGHEINDRGWHVFDVEEAPR